jgi:outer membrane cobalamin receptor
MEKQILDLLKELTVKVDEIQQDVKETKKELTSFKKEVNNRFDKIEVDIKQFKYDVAKNFDEVLNKMATKEELEQEKQTTSLMAKDLYKIKSEVLFTRENKEKTS